MLKPTHAIPASHLSPPIFITKIMQAVRGASEKDSVVRIRSDSSAKTVVAFTAHWLGNGNAYGNYVRDIHRRVYVETKLDENNNYTLVYMAKLFDEDAITLTYTEAKFDTIATDILRYLRMGHLPQA